MRIVGFAFFEDATLQLDTPAQESAMRVARSLWEGRFGVVSRKNVSGSLEPRRGNLQRNREPEIATATSISTVTGKYASDSALLNPDFSVSPANHRRPDVESVAQIGVQVADALEYAATQGILHRDVKPSNLLLDRFGTVWLTVDVASHPWVRMAPSFARLDTIPSGLSCLNLATPRSFGALTDRLVVLLLRPYATRLFEIIHAELRWGVAVGAEACSVIARLSCA